jgi:hypothetical protein
MTPAYLTRLGIQTLGALVLPLSVAATAHAQAWVPSQGEGAVSVGFTTSDAKYHYLTTLRVDIGEIDWQTLVTDVTYGLTDRIAVDLAVPVVASKYTGAFPHPTALDDGRYHTTFADVRFALRYNLTRGGAVITPYVGSMVPSHAYEFFAHAAAGRRLKELQVGAYVATLTDRILPGLFVSGRYGYGFTERVLDISHNRSMADLEIGYFVTPAFRTFIMGTGQITHGGIDLPLDGILSPRFLPVHDQIDRINYLNVGAGAAFSISDSVDVFGSFIRNVAARNGHALNRSITVGVSKSFKRRKTEPDTGATARREGSLIRCICQKAAN